MEEASRHLDEASGRDLEPSGRHLGGINEASGRHLGAIWEAPGKLSHGWGARGGLRASWKQKSQKPVYFTIKSGATRRFA